MIHTAVLARAASIKITASQEVRSRHKFGPVHPTKMMESIRNYTRHT